MGLGQQGIGILVAGGLAQAKNGVVPVGLFQGGPAALINGFLGQVGGVAVISQSLKGHLSLQIIALVQHLLGQQVIAGLELLGAVSVIPQGGKDVGGLLGLSLGKQQLAQAIIRLLGKGGAVLIVCQLLEGCGGLGQALLIPGVQLVLGGFIAASAAHRLRASA